APDGAATGAAPSTVAVGVGVGVVGVGGVAGVVLSPLSHPIASTAPTSNAGTICLNVCMNSSFSETVRVGKKKPPPLYHNRANDLRPQSTPNTQACLRKRHFAQPDGRIG